MGEAAQQIDVKYERLNSLYHIVNENSQDVLFQMNEVQEELYHDLHDSNIILKSRQHGVTTFYCLFGLDTAIHVPNIRVGIIAHNREDAERFFRDKVRYAWDHLDQGYKDSLKLSSSQDSARELTFSNNSSIRVGTSLRSATLNILHISEFAKVCAHDPAKAKEIVTGSLNTVHDGALVSIESTAEGRQGYFYDYCQQAMKAKAEAKELTRLDFKFHFFPWWRDPKNTLTEYSDVVITERLENYFNWLQDFIGRKLTDGQQAWYAKKEAVLGDDMKREHPSVPDECFHVSLEGAYFKRQFDRIYSENRITGVPYEEGLPVYTAWDLGMSDTTAIWFFQVVGGEFRFINFYENSGESLAHYAKILREKPYEYQDHFAPHDIEVRELTTGKSRLELARNMGIEFTVMEKLSKDDQIEAARNLLGKSWFDERRCEQGVSALESYRKEWDEKHGCWKNRPLHDWASNPADAYMIAAVANVEDAGRRAATQNEVKSRFAQLKRIKGMMK